MAAYTIETRANCPVFRCDWIIQPNGDQVKMHLPGPPSETESETKARGLAAVARRLRALASEYDDAARYLADPKYRGYRDQRVAAFVADEVEREIADGWRDETTGV